MPGQSVGDLLVRLGIDIGNFSQGLGKAERSMESTGSRMYFLGSRISVGFGLVMGGALAAVTNFGLKFDQAMTESLAIMDKVTPQMRKQMEDVAMTVSETSKFTSEQSAKAYYNLASAGYTAEESMALLPVTARFAQAGVMDLAKATELLAGAQTALGYRIKDDSIANMEQMVRVSDVLVEANNRALGTVTDFAEALSNKAGQALRFYSKSVEEGVAVLAAYHQQNIRGRVAGQQLSMMLRDLGKAAIKNADEWRSLDIAVFDGSGTMRNMADIIQGLEGKLGGLSDMQKRVELMQLGFTDRSLNATLALLGMSGSIRQMQRDLESAGGVTERVATKQLQSLMNQIQLLVNQGVNILIKLFNDYADEIESVLIPSMKNLLAVGKAMADMFIAMPGWFKTGVAATVTLLAAMGPVIFMMGSFTLAGKGLLKVFDLIMTGAAGLAMRMGFLASATQVATINQAKLVAVMGVTHGVEKSSWMASQVVASQNLARAWVALSSGAGQVAVRVAAIGASLAAAAPVVAAATAAGWGLLIAGTLVATANQAEVMIERLTEAVRRLRKEADPKYDVRMDPSRIIDPAERARVLAELKMKERAISISKMDRGPLDVTGLGGTLFDAGTQMQRVGQISIATAQQMMAAKGATFDLNAEFAKLNVSAGPKAATAFDVLNEKLRQLQKEVDAIAPGDKLTLAKALESGVFTTKQLSDELDISEDAIQLFAKQMRAAGKDIESMTADERDLALQTKSLGPIFEQLGGIMVATWGKKQNLFPFLGFASGNLSSKGIREATNDAAEANKVYGEWLGTMSGLGLTAIPVVADGTERLQKILDSKSPSAFERWTDDVHGMSSTMNSVFSNIEGKYAQMAQYITKTVMVITDKTKNAGERVAALFGGLAGIAAASGHTSTSNVFSGMATGASMGSVIPGIGTGVGAAIGGMVSAISEIASSGKKAQEEFFAAQRAIDDTRQATTKLYGSFENTMAIAGVLGVNLQDVWYVNGVAGAKALTDTVKELDARFTLLQTSLEKYGLTWKDLNTEMKSATMRKTSLSLFQEYNAMTGSGVAPDKALKGMSGAFNQLLVDAKETGVKIPQYLQPMIEQMVRMGLVTEDTARLLLGMSKDALPTWAEVEAAAKRYGIELDTLGKKGQQLRNDAGATQIIADWKVLTAVTDDLGGIWDSMDPEIQGLGDSVQELVTRAMQYGLTLPEGMRPILQAMIEAGRLTDDAGVKMTDLTQLTFAKDLTAMFEELILKIGDLIEAIRSVREPSDKTAEDVYAKWRQAPWADWPQPEWPGNVGTGTPGGGGSGPRGTGDALDATRMGAGGLVTRPTLALVGESGPEAVIPLSRLGDGAGNGGGGRPIQITVISQLDGRAVARAVTPWIPGEVAAHGLG